MKMGNKYYVAKIEILGRLGKVDYTIQKIIWATENNTHKKRLYVVQDLPDAHRKILMDIDVGPKASVMPLAGLIDKGEEH